MSGAANAAPATHDEEPGKPGFSRAAAPLAPSYTERSCLSKKRYWSQVDALVMAARCIERGHAGALGTYHCGNCAGWHLTRQV
jgi:hypothetical protein